MKGKRRKHDSPLESEKEVAYSMTRSATERLPIPEGDRATPLNSRAAAAAAGEAASRTSRLEKLHSPNGEGSEVTVD